MDYHLRYAALVVAGALGGWRPRYLVVKRHADHPMSDESANENSLAASAGCLLLVMGAVSAAFGIAALLGVSDRIELEFFGIELNDRKGQWQWVTGSIVAVVVGVFLLRTRRAA